MKYGILLGVLGIMSAHGATLVSFDSNIAAITNTAIANEVQAATVSSSFESTVLLQRGSGLTSQTFVSRFGAAGFTLSGEASALESSDYFTFTLSPAAGGSFDFSGTALTLVTQAAAKGPLYLGVYTSKGGFVAGNAIQTVTLQQTGTPQAAYSIDLSSLGVVSGPLEIRFYGYNAGGSGGVLSINSLSLNTTSVPEPSAAISILLGGTLLGAAHFSRRFIKSRPSAAN